MIPSKLIGARFISVTSLGAKGDGVTDDTTAINNALTAAVGIDLIIPPGTYKITSTLNVGANTTIYGYGATISTTAQITAMLFANGGAVLGLTIVGPASGTYNANATAIKCTGTNNSPSAPTFVNAPIVRDCTIRNFGSYGVNFLYVNGGIVENCKINGIGYAGVGGVSCNDTIVTKNTISIIGPGPGNADSYGVFIDRNNGTSEAADPRSNRCVISNNSISYVIATGGVNGQGIDTHAGVDFTIIGNIIKGCQVGIAAVSSSISGVPQLAPKRISIIGNSIDGRDSSNNPLNANYGIIISGAFNGSTVNEYAESIIIQGNSILNHGATNDDLNGAIVFQGTKSSICSGNTIRNPKSYGININLENKGIVIEGNTITDPHDNTLTAPACLRVTGNFVSGIIAGNVFVFENSGLDTYVAVESIRILGSLTNLDLDLSRCTFVGVAAGHLTYQELTTTGGTNKVNSTSLYEDRGVANISLVSGHANDAISVSFNKRFPAVPTSITIHQTGGIIPGGIVAALTTSAITATGFTITAYPYNLSTWSGSGTLPVCWSVKL